MKINGPYDPKKVEDKIYKLWEDSGFFNPDNLPKTNKKPFTIIMPPANANGNLHAGHALVMTIEDIITRYKRMRGLRALWLPGLDHAGFETQVVYEKELEKENRSRFKIQTNELYKEIWDFTQINKKNIESQIRKMGASCDWNREKFTLDKDIIKIVLETFDKLRKDGLVYRGKKIINWCPKHQTSLSELETENVTRRDKLYYLKYGPFIIATARPETKFGDQYVVMHSKDKRYKNYRNGQKIRLEWINGPVDAIVIKDKAIDMKFGTGVMTITPWHDSIDFEIAQRHNLKKQQIIDFSGKLTNTAGDFKGMKILEARLKIIERLKFKGLLEKIDENYIHTVKICYKCNNLIEPQIKNQWFLKMKPLAKPAIKAIESEKIKFIPSHYKKIILHWLNNILDWPLSRQIVWGIPIPAKFCQKCQKEIVDINDKKISCPECGGQLEKDTDTFDTWFSSSQWPFAALGYPDSKDFKKFYPTQIMETAGEIIFFWVARMIMLSLHITKKIPFSYVYLHGLVLDAKGQKMSKSRGNVINPLDLIDKYGTDALRISLVVGNTPGTPLALDENKIRGYKNFANKIWNAGRFVLTKTADYNPNLKSVLDQEQKKYLKELNKLIKQITKLMDEFKFYIAAEKIYHYFWHVFCDKIIEDSKKKLLGRNKSGTQKMLLEILEILLKLTHPFMPFITEEIYQKLPFNKTKKILMIQNWPK